MIKPKKGSPNANRLCIWTSFLFMYNDSLLLIPYFFQQLNHPFILFAERIQLLLDHA